jgi:hypothetical protein
MGLVFQALFWVLLSCSLLKRALLFTSALEIAIRKVQENEVG